MTLETGNSRKSLTFIEILIVIVLIGVMTGITIPRFRKTFNSLKIDNQSLHLQAFMNYLRQRSITEGAITVLTIDNENKEYWAIDKDTKSRLRTYSIPGDIGIESSLKEVFFYPDGSIDKVTIKLINTDNQSVSLTTQGVFGGVKLLPKE